MEVFNHVALWIGYCVLGGITLCMLFVFAYSCFEQWEWYYWAKRSRFDGKGNIEVIPENEREA